MVDIKHLFLIPFDIDCSNTDINYLIAIVGLFPAFIIASAYSKFPGIRKSLDFTLVIKEVGFIALKWKYTQEFMFYLTILMEKSEHGSSGRKMIYVLKEKDFLLTEAIFYFTILMIMIIIIKLITAIF